jgi:hypothetical protein
MRLDLNRMIALPPPAGLFMAFDRPNEVGQPTQEISECDEDRRSVTESVHLALASEVPLSGAPEPRGGARIPQNARLYLTRRAGNTQR